MTFWNRTDRSHIVSTNARFGRDLAGEISVVDVCFDIAGRTIAATNLGHILVFQTGSPSQPSTVSSIKKNVGSLKEKKRISWKANTKALPLRTIPTGAGSITNAHDGPINSVQTVPGGLVVVSGGQDGLIRLWSCPKNIQGSIQLIKTLNAHM
jgi:WD40 repeat protein